MWLLINDELKLLLLSNLPLLNMLGPFYHPTHSNISLDLAATITQEACWEFSDSFLEFPIMNPMDCNW